MDKTRHLAVMRPGSIKLLLRFAISGAMSGFIYAAIYFIAVKSFHFPAFIASAVGYLGGLLSGFAMHRSYTFRSAGFFQSDSVRYGLAQLLILSIISVESHLATNLRWPIWAIILSGIVTAPPLNFVLLNYWVFPTKSRREHEVAI